MPRNADLVFHVFKHAPMWNIGIAFDWHSVMLNLGPIGIFFGRV